MDLGELPSVPWQSLAGKRRFDALHLQYYSICLPKMNTVVNIERDRELGEYPSTQPTGRSEGRLRDPPSRYGWIRPHRKQRSNIKLITEITQ